MSELTTYKVGEFYQEFLHPDTFILTPRKTPVGIAARGI